MKRIKYKTFKRHIDLIRYAVRRAIHRQDIDIPARMNIAIEEYQMRNPPDFIEQCKQKSKGKK